MTRHSKAALLVSTALASLSLQAQVTAPRCGPDLTGSLVGASKWEKPSSPSRVVASLSRRVPEPSSTAFLSGVRGGWARYRFYPDDPADPGLVVEATRRITQLGAKALFVYLSPVVGSGEADLRSVAQSSRFQQVFSIAKLQGVQLLVLNVTAVGVDLPYFGSTAGVESSRLGTEFSQIRDLTAYLRSSSLLDGITVILKNWEGDHIYCSGTTAEEPETPGTMPCRGIPTPSADNVTVLLRRAAPMTRWLRNREDAVVEGRRTDLYPSPYAVSVLNAVDVNRVHDAIGGQPSDGGSHPRLAHLLPYVGADVLTYSSWDSVFHPDLVLDPPAYAQLGSGVQARLDEAFTFVLNNGTQKMSATALCGTMGYCLSSVGFGTGSLSERAPDPLALGVKRLVVSEWGIPENYQGDTTSKRTEAVLGKARTFAADGIRAAFFWALYDNEQVWFKTCSSLVNGKERECAAGTPLTCNPDGTTELPGIGCYDRNLWDLGGSFSGFTLGGATNPPGGAGPGFYLYRPDGRDSLAMTALNAYSIPLGLWAPLAPNTPVNVRVNRAPFYYGQVDGNAFEWERPADESRYLKYEIEVTGPAGFTTTTDHTWRHLAATQPRGSYTWRIRTTAADGLLASAWVAGPSFRIVSPQRFFPVAPCRVLDTRNPVGPLGGPSLSASSVRMFGIASQCGIPSDAVAIVSNHTVVSGASAGSISVFPGNVSTTPTQTVAFRVQQTRAVAAIDTLATDGAGSLKVRNNSGAAVDYILDVTGYFR